MLGLPSTTEVGKRLPKEAFYRNLKLDKRTRDEFVKLIDRITLANTVKPATANLADGQNVHEIMFLAVELKGGQAPMRAIEAIAKSNPHKLVFRTLPDEMTYVMRGGMHSASGLGSMTLSGPSMEEAWDSIVAQVVFGDVDGKDVDARIELAKKHAELEKEIAALDKKCRRERQISKRNELFGKLRQKQAELEALGKGE